MDMKGLEEQERSMKGLKEQERSMKGLKGTGKEHEEIVRSVKGHVGKKNRKGA